MSLFDDAKRWVARRAAAPVPVFTAARPIEHARLGSLRPDDRFPGVLAGRIACGSRVIAIRIDPDGAPLEDALALASSAVESLDHLDARCRQLIAERLLEDYNAGWRVGHRTVADGAATAFAMPPLSPAAFGERLQFESLEVTGPTTLTVWYGDDGLFWGHGIYLDSFDGTALSDVQVSLFG